MRALHKPQLLSGRTQLLHNDPKDRFTGCLEHLFSLPHWPRYSFCCIFFPSASTVFSALNAYSQRCHHLGCWAHGCSGALKLDATSTGPLLTKATPIKKPDTCTQCNAHCWRTGSHSLQTPLKRRLVPVSFWLLQKRSSSPGEAKLTLHVTKQQPHKFPKKPCVNNVWVCLFHLEKNIKNSNLGEKTSRKWHGRNHLFLLWSFRK